MLRWEGRRGVSTVVGLGGAARGEKRRSPSRGRDFGRRGGGVRWRGVADPLRCGSRLGRTAFAREIPSGPYGTGGADGALRGARRGPPTPRTPASAPPCSRGCAPSAPCAGIPGRGRGVGGGGGGGGDHRTGNAGGASWGQEVPAPRGAIRCVAAPGGEPAAGGVAVGGRAWMGVDGRGHAGTGVRLRTVRRARAPNRLVRKAGLSTSCRIDAISKPKGLLPARAGMAPRGPGGTARGGAAPRACGDGPRFRALSRGAAHCSPRVRGWPLVTRVTQWGYGLLPACAGMAPWWTPGTPRITLAPRGHHETDWGLRCAECASWSGAAGAALRKLRQAAAPAHADLRRLRGPVRLWRRLVVNVRCARRRGSAATLSG
ncbi:hypothetical protein STTU_3664 [Streptomyces sp. Tu6071]|nr:hypothetical protein STTU_3664 [Streptomyces sp. Tu6071]